MNLGAILSLWTVLAMVIFVIIVIWAWSGGRKRSFEEAARIPLEDDINDQAATADLPEGDH